MERLNARLFDRLQAERNPDRRALIAMFPGQIASLEQPLVEFLQAAFGGSRSDPAPLLRGVYLTSGTQEGTPIDRLTAHPGAGVRRGPGAGRRACGRSAGRSYFLERLLRDVIFGEAMLVSHSPAAVRRRIVARAAGFAVAALLAVTATGALLWQIRGAGEREIDAARTALAATNRWRGRCRSIPSPTPTCRDWRRCWTRRARCRAAWTMQASRPSLVAQSVAVAGCQARRGSRAVYRHALEWALLPRLVWRLEAQMRGNLSRPDFLYEATRVYLMLGNAGPLDRVARARMDAAGLADGISRRGVWRPCATRCCGISMRCWRSRCRRCRSMASWSHRRAARLPRCRWRSASIRGSVRPRRPSVSRPGGRATHWARRAWACSSALPASGSATGFPASSRSMASTRCCCPRWRPRQETSRRKAGCSASASNSIPNGPQMRALERDVIALVRGGLCAGMGC